MDVFIVVSFRRLTARELLLQRGILLAGTTQCREVMDGGCEMPAVMTDDTVSR